MQTRSIRISMALTLAVGIAVIISGCTSDKANAEKEVRVTIGELSGSARATVERVTAGGSVDQIAKEVERGRTVYDVEATVGGRHLEFLIADSDGAVLGTEVPVEFSQLPEPVQTAAVNFFGTASGLTIMQGVEYGETHYEIEGPKGGKTVEVTFDPAGKRTE